MTALTSVGNVRSCVRLRRLLNGFGLGREAMQKMVGVIPGQEEQYAAARVALYRQSHSSPLSSTEVLNQLHWLPIEWRIRFKLATLTFKALHTGRPPYLSDLLQYHEPTRSLRSSCSHQLSVPRQNLTFGSRAFRFSAPRVWNSLPVSIHFQTSFKDTIFSQPILIHLSILSRISFIHAP